MNLARDAHRSVSRLRSSRALSAAHGEDDMAGESITNLIDQQQWLDPIGDTLQTAIQSAYTAGGPAGPPVKKILSGTWLGHPLHPLLTDVPVGAWTVTALLDAVEIATGRSELAPGADASMALGLAG